MMNFVVTLFVIVFVVLAILVMTIFGQNSVIRSI